MKLRKIKIDSLANATNVMDLEVPAELEKVVPTGVPFIDEILGDDEEEAGGFTPSTCMLFTGTPGAGKSTLMIQVADAITGQKDTMCLYNTAEESPIQVRKRVKKMGIKNGFYIGQDTMVRDIIKHAKLLQKKFPKKQLILVVDSLQAIDDGRYPNGHTNSMTAVRATEMLADFCKETFAICIIIGHCTKDEETFAGKQQIKHIVDAHAHLKIDKKRKSPTFGMRLLEVQKNRFGRAGTYTVLDMRREGLKKAEIDPLLFESEED